MFQVLLILLRPIYGPESGDGLACSLNTHSIAQRGVLCLWGGNCCLCYREASGITNSPTCSKSY